MPSEGHNSLHLHAGKGNVAFGSEAVFRKPLLADIQGVCRSRNIQARARGAHGKLLSITRNLSTHTRVLWELSIDNEFYTVQTLPLNLPITFNVIYSISCFPHGLRLSSTLFSHNIRNT